MIVEYMEFGDFSSRVKKDTEVSMGLLSWIIIGALAGWIGSKIMGMDAEMGGMANILVGILGGVVGGWIMSAIGKTGVQGFSIWSFLVALLGSCVCLFIYKAIRK